MGKKESIIFGTKLKLKKRDTIKVWCEKNIIESKTFVSLDQSVSGEESVATILSTIAKKLKGLIPPETVFYSSFRNTIGQVKTAVLPPTDC